LRTGERGDVAARRAARRCCHLGPFRASRRWARATEQRAPVRGLRCAARAVGVTLRARFRGNERWAIAARLELRWEPWTLSLRVLDVRGANAGGGDRRSSLSAARHFSMAASRCKRPTCARRRQRSRRTARRSPFRTSSISAPVVSRLWPCPRMKRRRSPGCNRSHYSRRLRADGVVGNVSLMLSHDAVNLASQRHFNATSIPTSPLGELTLTRFSVEGGTDTYEVSGTALDGAGKEFRARVKMRGRDLLIESVAVEAVLRACPSNLAEAIGCAAENVARGALAQAAGVAASNAFRGNRGRRIRAIRPWTLHGGRVRSGFAARSCMSRPTTKCS